MIYCDTSVIVATLAAEVDSPAVRAWFSDHADSLTVSTWVGTETASALAVKRRMGILDDADWLRVSQVWQKMQRAELRSVALTDEDFDAATRLIERRELAIRAGDALHLAIVIREGISLATLDRRFADAARTMGVPVVQVLPQTP